MFQKNTHLGARQNGHHRTWPHQRHSQRHATSILAALAFSIGCGPMAMQIQRPQFTRTSSNRSLLLHVSRIPPTGQVSRLTRSRPNTRSQHQTAEIAKRVSPGTSVTIRGASKTKRSLICCIQTGQPLPASDLGCTYADTNGISKQNSQPTFQILSLDVPGGTFPHGILDHRGASHSDRLFSRKDGLIALP